MELNCARPFLTAALNHMHLLRSNLSHTATWLSVASTTLYNVLSYVHACMDSLLKQQSCGTFSLYRLTENLPIYRQTVRWLSATFICDHTASSKRACASVYFRFSSIYRTNSQARSQLWGRVGSAPPPQMSCDPHEWMVPCAINADKLLLRHLKHSH